jgi:hypothetical protein
MTDVLPADERAEPDSNQERDLEIFFMASIFVLTFHKCLRGTKCANAEPDKTNIETPMPGPRKVIIALIPRWKKPTETEKKTSPSGPNSEGT